MDLSGTNSVMKAMIHEYIGIHNNKITIHTKNNETEEFVVSSITDSFFDQVYLKLFRISISILQTLRWQLMTW